MAKTLPTRVRVEVPWTATTDSLPPRAATIPVWNGAFRPKRARNAIFPPPADGVPRFAMRRLPALCPTRATGWKCLARRALKIATDDLAPMSAAVKTTPRSVHDGRASWSTEVGKSSVMPPPPSRRRFGDASVSRPWLVAVRRPSLKSAPCTSAPKKTVPRPSTHGGPRLAIAPPSGVSPPT